MRKDFVTVTLSDGSALHVEAMAGGDEDVAVLPFRFDDIRSSIVALAETVSGILQDARPTSATAEFGIAVGAEAGKLTALLVQGTATANLKISLTWEKPKDDAAVGSR